MEKFNQKNIHTLIQNILTLRYDPYQNSSIPELTWKDFIPNNNDAWKKMEYVQVDSVSLLAEPDPERHALNGKN